MTIAEDKTGARPANGDSALTRFLRVTEIDSRLLGMIGALIAIWVGFHFYGHFVNGMGVFLTPRNLWNLSVQTSSIGIMATGMVFVIVTRHIDLSVGAVLGFSAMMMAIMQVWILPQFLGLGHPMIWVIAVATGIITGAIVGSFHGWIIAYLGVPAFIVTLGGLLVWRGGAFLLARGETISPVDPTFALLGGGPFGSVGSTASWVIAVFACLGIIALLMSGRAQRKRFNFPLRPMWADVMLGVIGSGLVLGFAGLVNSYPWPIGIVRRYAEANNVTVPDEGLFISHGFAIPVLILIVVGIMMTFLARRTRFGRYVFAIGGNPEAAELAGVNTRWVTLKIFALMGALTGLSAVVASARLNSATNSLGTLDELYVIAAAVIGGTSLSGGIGTIYGAIVGALVMQSLQTGMVLIGFDTAIQQVVVGGVLVLAVYIDTVYKNRQK